MTLLKPIMNSLGMLWQLTRTLHSTGLELLIAPSPEWTLQIVQQITEFTHLPGHYLLGFMEFHTTPGQLIQLKTSGAQGRVDILPLNSFFLSDTLPFRLVVLAPTNSKYCFLRQVRLLHSAWVPPPHTVVLEVAPSNEPVQSQRWTSLLSGGSCVLPTVQVLS